MATHRGLVARAAIAAALIVSLGSLIPHGVSARAVPAASGGSLTVAVLTDFDSFDPAVAGQPESTRVANELYSGLIGITPDNTLFPDLAASMPTVADGARVYTFHLRRGLRFADGSPLTAADVAYTINRAATPATNSWALSELSSIAGFDALQAGKAKTLSGVRVLDPLTVRFTLSRPDAIFPYRMSMSTFFIVDPAQVAKYGKNFGKHPLGSGPYKFQSYTPGQRLVLVRNPYYYRRDASGVQLPYIDKITWLINVNDAVAVLMLERGEVDVLADGIPKESYAAVAADPHWSKLIVRAPSAFTYQVGFNASMKPFTDVRVRRAIAMAINRPRLVKLVGKSRVFLNTNRYPKGFAAWDPTYQGFAYDPVAAKALLAKAGYPNGFTTTYLVGNWPDSADTVVGQAIQQDLAQIGVKVSIRTAPFATAASLTDKPNTIPMFTQWWSPDFPEASDFVEEQFKCGQEPPHGINNLFYCNHEADALLVQAESTVDDNKRIALERKLQRVLLDDVAIFPLFQAYYVTIRPPRIANFYIHPIYQWDYAYYRLAQ